MDYLLNPRADLPPTNIHPTYYSRPDLSMATFRHQRVPSYPVPPKRAKKPLCYDWIFSSASNVHVAIDRAVFKTYTSFKSYALTVADGRPVSVRGVGAVEIKIRRAAGSKESHTVCLENVLHIPEWICNVVSDVCFQPEAAFEHTWTQFGVNFFEHEDQKFRPWGYTENFRGLDRIVLSKHHKGRSPMLEDIDREVFSINLTWPQSQKDKWDELLCAYKKKAASRRIEDDTRTKNFEDARIMRQDIKSNLVDGTRWKLMPMSAANMKKHSKVHTLEATPSSR